VDRGGGPTPQGGLAYEPGLDGIRAVAVAAVLLFHANVAGSGGGFVGVSLFFTLSGYLITTLLLREHAERGTISLRGFWRRRIRRLAPAGLLTIAIVVVTAPLWLDAIQQRHLRGDVLASVGDVANWHFALANRAYADLFAAPSPLQHLWSLAVEEQFYVALPLIVVATLRLGRRGRAVHRVGVVAAALLAASTVAALVTRNDTVAYYGTDTRAGELLAGVVLASVLTRVPLRQWSLAARRVAAVAGVGAVSVFVALVIVCGTGSTWLDHGGFTAAAAVWVTVIVAAMVPGPVRWVLSCTPLVAIGRVSYGLYVVHWPLFLLLSPERMGVGGVGLLCVRLAVSGAVAAACYRWIERPIRYPRAVRPRRSVAPLFAASAASVAAAVLVMPLPAAAGRTVADVPAGPVRFAAAAAAADPPVRVAVIGSETSITWRLAAAAAATPGTATIVDGTDGACPIFRKVPSACDSGPDPAARLAAIGPVDVVVLAFGPADRGALGANPNRPAVKPWSSIEAAARPRIQAIIAGSAPVVVADAEPAGTADVVGLEVSQMVLGVDGMTTVDTGATNRDLLDAVTKRARPFHDDRVRVLVIGDSTSYPVARELEAQDGADLDVLWAGRDNCPLTPGYEDRWWANVTNRTDDCPTVNHGLADTVASFKPTVVVAVDSLPELAEQRYSSHDSWHVPGDRAWEAQHAPVAAALSTLLAPYGAQLLIADAPPITAGGFAGSPMARRDRLAAWNAVVDSWTQGAGSVHLLPMAADVIALERAAGHSLRPDGVHLSDDGAADVVRDVVLPAVLETTNEAPHGTTESVLTATGHAR
jgi:peptidoglycan/LPS O-acetylase OafA/YrhL